MRPEMKARVTAQSVAKDQARLAAIMAIRRAEADNVEIPHEVNINNIFRIPISVIIYVQILFN